jgi:hypothetical protein
LGLYPFGWLAAPGEFPLNFGPWMLVGLIPTFFGLSLIVIYLVTRDKDSERTVDQEQVFSKSSLAEMEENGEDNRG